MLPLKSPCKDGSPADFPRVSAPSAIVLAAAMFASLLCAPARAQFTISVTPSNYVYEGQSVTFQIVGPSDFTITGVVWMLGTTVISGATGTSYTIPSAQLSDAGSYSVGITSTSATSYGFGTVDFQLWVFSTAPGLSTYGPPKTPVGHAATFSVATTGEGPFTWTWYETGNAAPIATTATGAYTISSVQLSDAGSYYVVATNALGETATSATMTLVVTNPPVITVQPAATSVTEGQTAVLSVTATGGTPLTYTWSNGGQTLGGNSPTLTLTNVQWTQAGDYYVTVSNADGSVVSTSVLLSVNRLPHFSSQPISETVYLGGTSFFNADVDESDLVTWQWYKDGVLLATDTAVDIDMLAIPSAQASDAGQYWVVVTNAYGSATSAKATLTVITSENTPASISGAIVPAGEMTVAGNTVTFTITATGTPPLFYQWYLGSAPISGATSATLTLTNVQVSDSGNYSVVVSNAFGNDTRGPVNLAVYPSASTPTPTPVTSPTPTPNSAPTPTPTPTPTSALTPTPTPTPHPTPTPVSIVTPTPTPNLAPAAPSIETQPKDQSVMPGASATFWVAASGSPSPSYQWTFNGTAIPGATGPICTVANAWAANAGSYAVSIANSLGSITSASATLTLGTGGSVTPPAVALQPSSQTIAAGTTVVFSFAASGSQAKTSTSARISGAPFDSGLGAAATQGTGVTYQWFWNGVAIPGATDPMYVLVGATAANDGSYSCLATNSAGSIMSDPATLEIVQAPEPGHLINISCRAGVGTGANVLIAGFVVGGAGTSGSEQVLVRGSGPALVPFDVAGSLPDPQLQLFQSGAGGTSTLLGTNGGWSGSSLISSAAVSVGAFAWSVPTSHDSALIRTLSPGQYTAQIAGASGDTGVALAEVYDATQPSDFSATSPRLINISARLQVGTGGNVLIAGFVIGGTTSKTLLVRASGPALVPFGLSGTLPDPQLMLYRSNGDGSSTLLGANSGWAGDAKIAAAAASVGAFSWGEAATADSALLVTLPPGAYTAQVSGAGGDTGIALVEVYEVP